MLHAYAMSPVSGEAHGPASSQYLYEGWARGWGAAEAAAMLILRTAGVFPVLAGDDPHALGPEDEPVVVDDDDDETIPATQPDYDSDLESPETQPAPDVITDGRPFDFKKPTEEKSTAVEWCGGKCMARDQFKLC